MHKTLCQLMVLLLLGSCIEPIELGLTSDGNLLVVDGTITNEVGPYQIRLSRSLAFNNTDLLTSYFVPEKNSIVEVVDNLNNLYVFTETEPGRYSSDLGFQGQVGRSYKLKIRTQNNKFYESDFEPLIATPAINEIEPKFIEIEKISNTGLVTKDYGFEILVSTSDPSNEANFYRWTSSGIIEYHSQVDTPAEGEPTCWYDVPIIHNQVQVLDDRFSDGKVLSKSIGIAPYERPTRILINVNQYSVSQKAFEFWDQISKQQQNTGGIFDPPPARIKGNVFNSQNANETVLGYFGVSAVTTKYLVFNRYAVAKFPPPNPIPVGTGDCRLQVLGATSIQPVGF